MMTVCVGVAAHGFEGAGAGFEVGGEGVLVDDVEVDLALGEHLLGGDEGGVGVAVVEPHGAGRDVECDRGGGAAHAHDVADAADVVGQRGEAGIAHDVGWDLHGGGVRQERREWWARASEQVRGRRRRGAWRSRTSSPSR